MSSIQPLIQAVAVDGPRAESREGTAVGSVHAFILDKSAGRSTHAVLGLGGMLGLGKSYYPVPFDLLSFDAVRDVYVVTIDPQMLKGGPSWANHVPDFDAAYADRVARYYGGAKE